MSRETALRILAAVAIAALPLFFGWPGLRAGFTNDDLMNTFRAWNPPVSEHLRDTVLFWRFSHSYRPVGALFYRLLYDTFGFNPLPFRIACYTLLLLNLWLAYAVLRRLAHSRETAAVAVLLLAYHGQFGVIYANTGYCYDLLCFSFYTGAMLYYLRARERACPLPWSRVAVWAGLYVLCLNSKEMAVTLPVVILAYELLEKPPEWRRPFAWVWRSGRVPLVGAAMTALFIAGRIAVPEGLPSIGPYRPEFSLRVYLEHAHYFLGCLLYRPEWLTPAVAGAFLALLLGTAALWRSLVFRLGVVWALVGILPVAFIFQRGLDAVYVALPGLALAVAAVISALARRVRLRPAAVFVGVLAAMFFVHRHYGRLGLEAWEPNSRHIMSIYEQLRAHQRVPFPPGSRILFLRDPFRDGSWNALFLTFFSSGDRTLLIDRAEHLAQEKPAEPLSYDVVFDYEQDRLVQCDAAKFRNIRISDLPSLECGAPRALRSQ